MDDDTLDSMNASDFLLDDTAFDADSMPVESMDFAIFSGDVVPRDGIQRPILTGGDSTRPHAPRAAREKPVHVTHIHQTIIQSTMPVAQGEGYNFLSNLVQFPIVCILLYFVLYSAVF